MTTCILLQGSLAHGLSRDLLLSVEDDAVRRNACRGSCNRVLAGRQELRLRMPVVEFRIPVGATTFRREVQHEPERIRVWRAPRVLAGVGHRPAHLTAVEVAHNSVAQIEQAETGHSMLYGFRNLLK